MRFADALGGRNTALILHDVQSGRNSAVACVRTDPEHLRRYNEHYCEINPWMRKGSADLAAGMIGIGEMHCATEELIRTEFRRLHRPIVPALDSSAWILSPFRQVGIPTARTTVTIWSG
jgi:hypothetical protein